MHTVAEQMDALRAEVAALHQRHQRAKTVGPNYFEPGNMEYLNESDGFFDEATGALRLIFEARGTRYDGRTEQIERVQKGDAIRIVREKSNPYNSNNFTMTTATNRNVGNMPAELCNAVAPLYDAGLLTILGATASYVEPITRRSRYAKQAVLFVEMRAQVMPAPEQNR